MMSLHIACGFTLIYVVDLLAVLTQFGNSSQRLMQADAANVAFITPTTPGERNSHACMHAVGRIQASSVHCACVRARSCLRAMSYERLGALGELRSWATRVISVIQHSSKRFPLLFCSDDKL
jgi:hypothetical protein